jgi:hypothetical protein
MSLIRFNNLDLKTIKFKQLQKTPDATYFSEAVRVQDGVSVPINVQLPWMQVFDTELNPEMISKAYVDLVLADDELYQLLRGLDTYIVQHVYKNRAVWFNGVEVNMVAVEDCYKSPVNRTADNATLKLKLNVSDGVLHTVVFSNKNHVPVETLKDLSSPEVVCIAQLRGLKVHKASITPDWVLHSIKLKSEHNNANCLFAE